jgi:hypothetical protein
MVCRRDNLVQVAGSALAASTGKLPVLGCRFLLARQEERYFQVSFEQSGDT